MRIAAALRGGDVLVLSGDLGAGKTTLTQGLARGLGIDGPVTSPTFVIAKSYEADRARLIHVDAYRLASFGELDELADEVFAPDAITIVEWGEPLAEAMPGAMRVTLAHDGDGRSITVDERLRLEAV